MSEIVECVNKSPFFTVNLKALDVKRLSETG